jgi:hypothetical protein
MAVVEVGSEVSTITLAADQLSVPPGEPSIPYPHTCYAPHRGSMMAAMTISPVATFAFQPAEGAPPRAAAHRQDVSGQSARRSPAGPPAHAMSEVATPPGRYVTSIDTAREPSECDRNRATPRSERRTNVRDRALMDRVLLRDASGALHNGPCWVGHCWGRRGGDPSR